MKPSEYQDWMKQAFLAVEAEVGNRLIQSTGKSITEDQIRQALIDGLKAAHPTRAIEVEREWPVPWSGAQAWVGSGKAPAKSLRHDIAVKPSTSDKGLVCEVAWLKTTATEKIIGDIWKVILTRSTQNEQSAVRTYLLIGGETKAFRDTLKALASRGAYIKWSKTKGRLPGKHIVGVKGLLNDATGFKAFEKLLGWGTGKKRKYRTPPPMFKQYNLSVRATWFRRLGLDLRGKPQTDAAWHAVLCEVNCRAASKNRQSYAEVKKRIEAL